METTARAESLRILVVDDNRIDRKVLRTLLLRSHHHVIEAHNGVEAVAAFQQQAPDLVLMDVLMPVMDGYEAARQMKLLGADRFVPIIFLTGVTDDRDLARCVEAGGDDFLTKPYSRVQLEAKIEALRRLHHLNATLRAQNEELRYHQERIRRDHVIAEELFSKIVQPHQAAAPNIRHIIAPAAEFSGDLFLSAYAPSGVQFVLLGDFTGHGLAAAIGALPTAETFYAMTGKGFAGSRILEEVNSKLERLLPTGLFLAACLLEIDATSSTMRIWNGGVPDLLIWRGPEVPPERFASCHLPLGIRHAHGGDFNLQSARLRSGDRILLFSDGVIEAQNDAGEIFGEERLLECLCKCPLPEGLIDHVVESLSAFQQGATQKDDITLAEVTFDPERFPRPEAPSTAVQTLEPLDFDLSIELGPRSIRSIDPVPLLVQRINEFQRLGSGKDGLYVVLTELYSNALEHGLLGLDSALKCTAEGFVEYYELREQALASLQQGRIRIEVFQQPEDGPRHLRVRLTDSGTGFEHARRLAALEEDLGLSGRGLRLVRGLCKELAYHGSGNCVEAVYCW